MRRSIVLLSAIIMAVTFTAFYPSLWNGFTNFDDHVMVYENVKIMSLSWESIRPLFTTVHYGLYHPLVLLSYALEFRFFGPDPAAYHVVNLLLHLANSLLVFWLIALLSGDVRLSFIVALLFGVHPLHVESVAWVSERKDVLYAFFYLQSLVCYVYYLTRTSRRWHFYGAAFILFVFSLLSKPMAVTLPLVLATIDYYLARKYDRRAIVDKIPFAALMALFAWLAMAAHYPAGYGSAEAGGSYVKNVFLASSNILFYLGKTVFPVKLSCFYPFPPPAGAPLSLSLVFATLAVGLLSLLVAWSHRYTRKFSFGFLFFLVTIFPVIQLIRVGLGANADRYMYMPSVGLFFVAGVVFLQVYRMIPLVAGRRALVVAAGALIVLLSAATWRQCRVWNDSITLYSNVLKYYPDSAIAYNNRGCAYTLSGDHDKAFADFEQALRYKAAYPDAFCNRGAVYLLQGDYDRAMSDFKSARKLRPTCEDAYIGMGNVSLRRRDYDKALFYFNIVVRLNSRSPRAYLNRGTLRYLKGEYDEALSDFLTATRLAPHLVKAHRSAGEIYFKRKEYAAVVREFSQIMEWAPPDAVCLNYRGSAYAGLQEYTSALADFTGAVTLDPDYAEAYFNRGNTYGLVGQYDRAIADYSKAIEIDPAYAQAYFNRAVAYFLKEEYARSRSDVTMARKLRFSVDPGFKKDLEAAEKNR